MGEGSATNESQKKNCYSRAAMKQILRCTQDDMFNLDPEIISQGVLMKHWYINKLSSHIT